MVRAATIPGPNRPVELHDYPRPQLEDGAAFLRTVYTDFKHTGPDGRLCKSAEVRRVTVRR